MEGPAPARGNIPSGTISRRSSGRSRKCSEMDLDQVPLCPAGHEANLEALMEEMACDWCGKNYHEGYFMHSCRECEYDLCPGCASNLQKNPEQQLNQAVFLLNQHDDVAQPKIEEPKETIFPRIRTRNFQSLIYDVPPLPQALLDPVKVEDFEPLFRRVVAEWKTERKGIVQTFDCFSTRGQLTFTEFEKACEELGNTISNTAYDKEGALQLLGINGTTLISMNVWEL